MFGNIFLNNFVSITSYIVLKGLPISITVSIMSEWLDLIIFGATGFTGKHAVEEIHRISKNDPELTWGISGRSQSKLEKIIKDLQDKTGDDLSKIKVFVADINDHNSLVDMTKKAKVIVNCCGPYKFYGEQMVKSCIETHTHYVDISGEPPFMEEMQLKYNKPAQQAGVYIVSSCGFDSIPSDLGLIFLQQQFKGTVNSAEIYIATDTSGVNVKLGDAGINYGTWESLVNGIADLSKLGPIRQKLFPTELPTLLPKLKSRCVIHKCPYDGYWYLPFPGADETVIYRTQRFFYEYSEKRPVQTFPYIGFPNIFVLFGIVTMMGVVALMAQFSLGRMLLLRYPRLFSAGLVSRDGPSERIMKGTKFHVHIHGIGWDKSILEVEGKPVNKSMLVKVSVPNPGYGATCTALLFSGITMLRESHKMPGTGGVMSPGAAFSKTSLIEKLNENKIIFEVIQEKDLSINKL